MPTSATKQIVSLTQVHQLTCECLHQPAAAIQELSGGYFNTAFAVTLEDGQKLVLKVAPDPHASVLRQEHDLMSVELQAMKLAAARTSLPVPRIIAEYPGGSIVNSPCFFMEFIEGTSLDELRKTCDAGALNSIYVELGVMIRELHQVTGPYFGFAYAPKPSWSEAFIDIIHNLALDAKDVHANLAISEDEIESLVISFSKELDEVKTPIFLHKDLWFANVFIDPKTNHIVGLTDWERSLFGDPLLELVFGYIESVTAIDIREPFYRSYANGRNLSPHELIRIDLYDLYFMMLLIVEAYFRNYRNEQNEQHLNAHLLAIVNRLKTLH